MDPETRQTGDFFVRQLMLHRKRIYAFILTLVANVSDADDIMQDTAALMWEKYSTEEQIDNFAALGMRIAHFKVLEFRKKHYRKNVQFDSQLFDMVLGGAVSANETVDSRLEAMNQCLSKLNETSRKLLLMRHQKGQTIKRIAESIHISPHTAYKRIASLHERLVRCIRRTLRGEGVL